MIKELKSNKNGYIKGNKMNKRHIIFTRGIIASGKSTGTKHFIDIDCDTKEPEVTELIVIELNNANIKYHIIETHGGYHFLLHKDTMPQKFNLKNVCQKASGISPNKAEVMINGNGMVPVPGTMQIDFFARMR